MDRRELLFILKFRNEASRAIRGVATSIRSLGAAAGQSARRGLTALTRQLDVVGARAIKVGAALAASGTRLREIGSVISLGFSAPLAAAGFGILRTAGQFEQALNQVQAISGATAEEFDRLKESAADLGATTAFTATDAANGLTFLAKTGLSVSESLGAIGPALNLAAAGNLSLAESSNIVTNVLKGFGQEVDQLPVAVDVLSKAFTSANVDIRQLSQSFAKVGPVAVSFNQDFAETAAVLGALGDAGLQASEAGTSLRRLLINLATDSAKTSGILSNLGVSVRDSNGEFRSLVDIFGDLKAAGLTPDQAIKLFGARGLAAGNILLRRGTEGLKELTEELRNSGGTAQALQETQLRGLFGAFRQLRSAVEAVAIAIGDSGFLGSVTNVIKSVTEFIRGLRGASKEALAFVTTIILVGSAIGPVLVALGLSAFAVGQLTVAFGKLTKAISFTIKILPALGKGFVTFLLSPIGLITVALAAAGFAFLKFKDTVVTVGGETATVLDFVVSAFELLRDSIAPIGQFIADTFTNVVNAIGNAFSGFDVEISANFENIADVAKVVANGIIRFFEAVGVSIAGVFNLVAIVASNAFEKILVRGRQVADVLKGVFERDAGAIAEALTRDINAPGLFDGVVEGGMDALESLKQVFDPGRDPLGDLLGEIGQRAGAKFRERNKEEVAKGGEAASKEFTEGFDPETTGDNAGRVTAESYNAAFGRGIRQGFNEFLTGARDVAAQSQEAFTNFAEGAREGLLDFIETGKFSFKDFTLSLLRDLNRIAINRVFSQLVQGFEGAGGGGQEGGGGIGGFLGGLFGPSRVTNTPTQGGVPQATTQATAQAVSQGVQPVVAAVQAASVEDAAMSQGLFASLGSSISSGFSGLGSALGSLGSSIGGLIGSLFGGGGGDGAGIAQGVLGLVGSVAGAFAGTGMIAGKRGGRLGLIPTAALAGAQLFQTGGIAGRDSVPAMLTPGEVVLDPTQSKRFLRGDMEGAGGGGDRAVSVTVNINGVSDFESFRANKGAVQAAMAQALERANTRNN